MGRGETITEVARTFDVSRSSVKRYVKMELKIGSLEPSKPPGSQPKINGAAEKLLILNLEERPVPTLAQKYTYLLEVTGTSVDVSTLWQNLRGLGYTLKKRSVESSERNEFDRVALKVLMADRIEAGRFVFVDEMGSNTSLYPLCSWPSRGQSGSWSVSRNRGKNTTLVASMTVEGYRKFASNSDSPVRRPTNPERRMIPRPYYETLRSVAA